MGSVSHTLCLLILMISTSTFFFFFNSHFLIDDGKQLQLPVSVKKFRILLSSSFFKESHGLSPAPAPAPAPLPRYPTHLHYSRPPPFPHKTHIAPAVIRSTENHENKSRAKRLTIAVTASAGTALVIFGITAALLCRRFRRIRKKMRQRSKVLSLSSTANTNTDMFYLNSLAEFIERDQQSCLMSKDQVSETKDVVSSSESISSDANCLNEETLPLEPCSFSDDESFHSVCNSSHCSSSHSPYHSPCQSPALEFAREYSSSQRLHISIELPNKDSSHRAPPPQGSKAPSVDNVHNSSASLRSPPLAPLPPQASKTPSLDNVHNSSFRPPPPRPQGSKTPSVDNVHNSSASLQSPPPPPLPPQASKTPLLDNVHNSSFRPPPPPPPQPPQASKTTSLDNVHSSSLRPLPPPPPPANLPPILCNSGRPPPPPPCQIQQKMAFGKDGSPLPKLKPLHWDKVRAAPDHSMVWDKIRSSSFELDEKMIESLFGYNSKTSVKTEEVKSKTPSPSKHVLEHQKLQNITILLKALNATTEQVCDALMQGKGLSVQQLEALVKMVPSKEEEEKLSSYEGDLNELDPAEKFVKALLNIPFAFPRMEVMLYMETFQDEVFHLRKSFDMLEEACKELRSSRLFLRILEAVLKTGNRMNVGTIRGGAKAFKLDALLKLADVKGTDGKTTLLHFVVQEIIRSEGSCAKEMTSEKFKPKTGSKNSEEKEEDHRTMGLDLVLGLSNELSNVKKTASMDLDVLITSVSNLSNGMNQLKHLAEIDSNGGFGHSMNSFLKHAERVISELKDEEKRVLLHVREITEYYHGNVSKDEANPLRIFVIVKDFLSMLDRVCKDVRSLKNNPVIPFR